MVAEDFNPQRCWIPDAITAITNPFRDLLIMRIAVAFVLAQSKNAPYGWSCGELTSCVPSGTLAAWKTTVQKS